MGKGQSTAAAAAGVAVSGEPDDLPDSFICCICLDLLFKPIVLCCGHISCFWCVHKSMSGFRESHCPICRHPYNHFPSVSEMLHHVLFTMYPVSYKRRQEQTLLEEKEMGFSSPQFDKCRTKSPANQEFDHLKDHERPSTATADSDLCSGPCFTSEEDHKGNRKQLSVADVQCSACKQMLFHPVFLNCGHGYCEICISCSNDEMLKCVVCHSSHPTGVPKVCLELDHFLEEQLPEEYAARRDAVRLKQANIKIEKPSSCSHAKSSKKGSNLVSMLNNEFSRSKRHFGVGCDFCGMYPITGDRYQCKDCVEEIGFDLCGDCYNTRSKRPGRFNQQHTPEHKLERVNSNYFRQLILGQFNRQSETVAVAIANSYDISDVPETESPSSFRSVDAEEDDTVVHMEIENN